ncbi:MAG: FdhF/YdeP family oxidoreductase [Zavarzinella sp.]
MKAKKTGGGWAAIWYSLRMANKVGWWKLWRSMRAKNACKTCALGMGGQKGGMRNESGHWPEVCKKSFQAMIADMQKGITADFFQQYSIAQLQTLSPRELEWCGRLTQPVYAGEGDSHFRVVDWQFALERIARQLRENAPNQTFFYASGRSSNEAAFLLQLFARVYGTNYVNNCSYYCHQASGVGLNASVGSGTATIELDDLDHADLVFLIGGNPASNHPRLMRSLMKVRRSGGDVIVINPIKEVGLVNFSVPSDVRSLLFGTKIASEYLQPHIGGDLALLSGIGKAILELNAVDHEFLQRSTDESIAYLDHLRQLEWADIVQLSGISKDLIEKIARRYAQAKRVVFGWTMGITHHQHGVANVQTIVNLALIRGMVGKKHAGLMPIRGHSNIQGIGSVGVVPVLKQQIIENLEKLLGVTLPTTPGKDTMACMVAADEGEVNSAFCLGGNLYGSNPDAQYAHQALSKLQLVTYLNTTLNTGHPWGCGKETLILPVLARDEEPQPTTQESMFNYIRMSEGNINRLTGPRSEVDIITSLADAVLGKTPIDWIRLQQHQEIRAMIAQAIPGFEAIALLDKTREEFHIKGRLMHDGKFPTASGKAKFAIYPLPPLQGESDELRLMTIRSEGQFNTVVYEETDIYRGQERRDVILMNAQDITRLGLKLNQAVTISSTAGEMHQILVRAIDITPGNAAMYYPEANILVPKDLDSQSKTPAFKCIPIRIRPQEVPETSKTALPVVS